MHPMNDPQNETPETEPKKPPPVSIRLVPAPDGSMAPLFAAKAKARLEFGPIVRDREVTVRPQNSPEYKFTYAELSTVRDAVDKALGANGLDLWHAVCTAPDLERELHTYLTHASGAYVEAVIVLPRVKLGRDGERELTIQDLGSAITYWERYSAVAMLGVASEHDDDGNAGMGNEITAARNKSQERRREMPPAPKEKTPEKSKAKAEEHPHAPPAEPKAEAQRPPTTPPPAPAQAAPAPQAAKPLLPSESGPGGPLTQAQSDTIRDGFKRLGLKGQAAVKFCYEVAGKNGTDFGWDEGKLMVAVLSDEAKTQQALNAIAGGA